MEHEKLNVARAKLHDFTTPKSPSPYREIPECHTPIMIPTEKVSAK